MVAVGGGCVVLVGIGVKVQVGNGVFVGIGVKVPVGIGVFVGRGVEVSVGPILPSGEADGFAVNVSVGVNVPALILGNSGG